MHPVDGDSLIASEMIIEIDIDNDATDTSIVPGSISSISGSAQSSASTLSPTESTPSSSISRMNSTYSSFSRMNSSTSSLTRISPNVSSPIIATDKQSPSHSSIVTTSKHDLISINTTDKNNPNNNMVNLNKRNKRRKRVTYYTLTDSSYCLYLRNRIIEDNQSSIISLSSIRRTAMNHFETIKYKSTTRTASMGSTRRSLRFIDPKLGH